MPENGLAGAAALVTGASRGIGRAIAQRLGADGALVAVHYASNDAAAKQTVAAIDVLSRTLAQALGPQGITVNTVTPGVIDTDTGAWMHSSAEVEAAIVSATALGRAGQPADVAGVVAFLASHDARWITGVTIEARWHRQ